MMPSCPSVSGEHGSELRAILHGERHGRFAPFRELAWQDGLLFLRPRIQRQTSRISPGDLWQATNAPPQWQRPLVMEFVVLHAAGSPVPPVRPTKFDPLAPSYAQLGQV